MKILKIVMTVALCFVIYGMVYQAAYDKGMHVGHDYAKSHYRPYIDLATQFYILEAKYGRLKDVPWDEFTIEQKMILCAAGSPGNHFRDKDVEELLKRYGPK